MLSSEAMFLFMLDDRAFIPHEKGFQLQIESPECQEIIDLQMRYVPQR